MYIIAVYDVQCYRHLTLPPPRNCSGFSSTARPMCARQLAAVVVIVVVMVVAVVVVVLLLLLLLVLLRAHHSSRRIIYTC